jgi:hypothetical protein
LYGLTVGAKTRARVQLLAYPMLDDRTGTKTGNWTPYAPRGESQQRAICDILAERWNATQVR